jgi:hypothetical protein
MRAEMFQSNRGAKQDCLLQISQVCGNTLLSRLAPSQDGDKLRPVTFLVDQKKAGLPFGNPALRFFS